jgi:hypothetical protein
MVVVPLVGAVRRWFVARRAAPIPLVARPASSAGGRLLEVGGGAVAADASRPGIGPVIDDPFIVGHWTVVRLNRVCLLSCIFDFGIALRLDLPVLCGTVGVVSGDPIVSATVRENIQPTTPTRISMAAA